MANYTETTKDEHLSWSYNRLMIKLNSNFSETRMTAICMNICVVHWQRPYAHVRISPVPEEGAGCRRH